MARFANRFWNEEKGSAVIDWCVLGAGAASLCIAMTAAIAG